VDAGWSVLANDHSHPSDKRTGVELQARFLADLVGKKVLFQQKTYPSPIPECARRKTSSDISVDKWEYPPYLFFMSFLTLRRFWMSTLLVLLGLYAGGAVWVYHATQSAGIKDPGSSAPQPDEKSEDVAIRFSDANPWSRPGLDQIAAKVEDYRLAGTYQTYRVNDETSDPEPETSLALVDDLEKGSQEMVREGDELGVFRISAIRLNEIDLSHQEQTWTLTLPGRLTRSITGSTEEQGETRITRFSDLPALEQTPFGRRVAENQWVIDRQAVKKYAGAIVGSPLRATQLYRSFRQVAGDEGRTEAGFEIQMKGEKNFFAHMGMRDDDIILKVNSMKMKNQARAEYLVSEFMQDRMGMVVLDVERNGEVQKLIYLIED
jgi:hypothetical protein